LTLRWGWLFAYGVFTLSSATKDDVRKLVHAAPFVPFTIHLADGGQLRVPTVDHIAVPPAGGRIFVFGEDERYDVVTALMITRVTVDREPATSNHSE
jgi:hypothetical protein